MDDSLFFRKAGPNAGLTAYRSLDGERIGYVPRSGCIETRDLLLREFPIDPKDLKFAGCDTIVVTPKSVAEQQRKERRERIATAVLAGLAADPGTNDQSVRVTAEVAVEWADALIAALDEENDR